MDVTASPIALKKMIHFCILIPSRNLRGYTRRLQAHAKTAQPMTSSRGCRGCWVGRARGTALIVHLDYSAESSNTRIIARWEPGVGAILRVRYRVTDRVGPCIPDRAVSKQFTD